MAKPRPLFAAEKTAAELLDLPLKDFRQLVDMGVAPKPVLLGDRFPRWNVRELEARLLGGDLTEELAW